MFFARSTNYLDKDFDSTMAVAVAVADCGTICKRKGEFVQFGGLIAKVQEQIVYYIII